MFFDSLSPRLALVTLLSVRLLDDLSNTRYKLHSETLGSIREGVAAHLLLLLLLLLLSLLLLLLLQQLLLSPPHIIVWVPR